MTDPNRQPLWNRIETFRSEKLREAIVGEELSQRARDHEEAFLGAVRACPEGSLFCRRAFVCADDGLRVEAFGADALRSEGFPVFGSLSQESFHTDELLPAQAAALIGFPEGLLDVEVRGGTNSDRDGQGGVPRSTASMRRSSPRSRRCVIEHT